MSYCTECWYDELLVREIASSRIPIIVGVGHEVDESLSDLVADKSASTPSNAAQMLVPDRFDATENLKYRMNNLATNFINKIENIESSNKDQLVRAVEKIEIKLESFDQKLNSLKTVLGAFNPRSVLERGYAIIRGRIATNEMIEIQTIKNTIKAEIKEIYE